MFSLFKFVWKFVWFGCVMRRTQAEAVPVLRTGDAVVCCFGSETVSRCLYKVAL